MSFLLNEPTTFINIKLTDDGRRLLSLGKLTFDKAVISDREINYGIDRTGSYQICMNRILSPKDAHPPFTTNFDGSSATTLSSRFVGSSKSIVTATTTSTGFFTGSTNAFAIDQTETLGTSYIAYSANTPNGSSTVIIFSAGTYFPIGGELVYIPWQPIQNSGKTYTSDSFVASGNPTVDLWYRVLSSNTASATITLDRAVPNFGITDPTSSEKINIYFYPFNGIESYYGSAATINTKVWNMNIVRTSSIPGTNSLISGYTTYGSIQFNGTKQYLGFSAETREIGIVHYTNEFTGNTYAEQLIEKSVIIDIPNLMWHNFPATAGSALLYGVRLTDSYGNTFFDSASQTTYRELRDSISSAGVVVGRVYHKLKIIVITDPELLTALTYKSNRNYSLPKANLGLTSVPKYPLNTSNATGLCQSGMVYYVTYITSSVPVNTSGVSFGYPQAMHCGYINQINGQVDSNGNPQFLTVNFPFNAFPYLRRSSDMNANSSFSGTGWNANSVQILINEVALSAGTSLDSIPSDNWRLISSGGTGNGVYTGDTTDLTIDPIKLLANQFVVSRQDFVSGSTYALSGEFSAFTQNNNVFISGLTFGNESFFFGNIQADILATSFKSIITVLAKNNDFNSSLNQSFNGTLDPNTFITEIGILNLNNTLVAVGKPTYPITKNSSRYLAFQLEIDF
jgi:hypothetical protein